MAQRLTDLFLSSALIIVLSPVLALLWIAVILKDGRPGLIAQNRLGKDCREFKMLKFRSMRVGAEDEHEERLRAHLAEGGSFIFHDSRDSRRTRFGKILRRSSADELPQLINVLAGQMSLVGPRPMLRTEAKFLTQEQKLRFSVRPGITGLAQVNGRGSIGAEAYLNFDLWLVKNFSMATYWKILLATPGAVIGGKGAG